MMITTMMITLADADASTKTNDNDKVASPQPKEVVITEWPIHDDGHDAHGGDAVTSQYMSEAVRDRGNGNDNGVQTLSNPILTKLRDYQLVRPQSIGGSEAIVEQLAPGDHPETLSYRIQAFGKDFDLTLNKNNELFSPDYQQIRLAYDPNDLSKAPRVEQTRSVHCYYHGHVNGDSNSQVTMSTCNGLQGSIRGNGEYFAVEPASFASSLPTSSTGFSSQSMSTDASIGFSPSSLPTKNANPLHAAFPLGRIPSTDHLVYRHSDLQEEVKTCGLPSDNTGSSSSGSDGHDHSNNNDGNDGRNPSQGQTKGEGIAAAIPATNNNGAFSEAPIDDASAPAAPPTLTATRGTDTAAATSSSPSLGGRGPGGARETIELLVFNDNQRWKNKGESTEANTLAILNEMKQFYSSTTFDRHVNVVLVGQVTFSQGDPYTADMTDSGVAVEGERGLLQVFHRYRNAAQNVLPAHDNGQLFSERRFTSNIMGLAGVGSMCSEQSGSITCMTSDSMVKNAMISAHETGHTLTMMHDGVYNSCPSGGFIMQTTTGTATTFSHCSVDSANGFLPGAQCLYNYAERRAALKRDETSWLANSWSDCSATCGAGIQVRTIDCRDTIGTIRPAKECNEFMKPLSVRVCNATACDACARNCSGIGICRNGECLCPAGSTGKHCEVAIPMTFGSSRSDDAAPSKMSEKTTSTMALAVTATVTGVALACASLLWLCRLIQRHAKDRSSRMNILASSKSHSQLRESSSTDFVEAPTPNPTPTSGHDSSDAHDLSSLPSPNDARIASSSMDDDMITRSLTSVSGVPAGLHKTPRSIPRSITVATT